jgi:hypothetical protein
MMGGAVTRPCPPVIANAPMRHGFGHGFASLNIS